MSHIVLKEIHNGWVIEIGSQVIGYHWNEGSQLIEELVKRLNLKDKFAVIDRKEWARQQKSVHV